MAPAVFLCVPAGSKKSVPAGPGQRDDVAISVGGVCRQKVLPYQTGLRAERGTPNKEDHCQRCVVTARNNKRGARGVLVIVAGNGHGDSSSNPGRGRLHFT